MKIEIRKSYVKEDPTSVSCHRNDGTTLSWPLHRFFEVHDLSHLAIEQTLGWENGFWGLIAQGWNLEMFIGRMPKADLTSELPYEACYAGLLVGALQAEFTEGRRSEGAILAELFDGCISMGLPMPALEAQDVIKCRIAVGELLDGWNAVESGAAMSLDLRPTTLVA